MYDTPFVSCPYCDKPIPFIASSCMHCNKELNSELYDENIKAIFYYTTILVAISSLLAYCVYAL